MARITKVNGRTSRVDRSRTALVPSPASVAKVATISRSLRQETARPNRVNASRIAPAVQVEMAWKRAVASKSSGREHQHAGQPVQCGFQARARRCARRPDQPQHGVDQSDGNSHTRA